MPQFEASVPKMWPASVHGSLGSVDETHHESYALPPAIGGRFAHERLRSKSKFPKPSLLEKQERKFQADWDFVSKAFPNPDADIYLYYWLIVNTRCFYYEFYDREPPEKHDDRMVMVPFMDYFNHSDQGVSLRRIYLQRLSTKS